MTLCTTASGQSAGSNLYVKAALRPGFVLPEYSLFPYLVNDYVHSFNISVSKQSTGVNYWAQLFNYPESGIALQYSTLGNKEIFGNEISLYPYVGIPILDKGKITLWNQLGMGIGIANKKFDPESNPYNVAIGSYVNIHFNFELNLQYQVHPQVFAYSGLSFDHLSNGNLGEPNLGINTMTINAGLRYLAGKKSPQRKFDLPPFKSTSRFSVITSGGAKHARALQSKSYFVSAISLEWKYKLFRTFYPGIGADVFYDGSTQAEIQAFGKAPYAPGDDFKSGIHLTQELVYNRFSIALQEGFYLLLKDKAFNNRSYHRFIMRHQFGDRFFAQVALKAHVVVLDYLEFGIGYHLKP